MLILIYIISFFNKDNDKINNQNLEGFFSISNE